MASTDARVGRLWVCWLYILHLAIFAVGCDGSAHCGGGGLSTMPSPASSQQAALRYLQKEQSAVVAAQGNIIEFLRSRAISIGEEPKEARPSRSPEQEFLEDRLAISTEESPIECRISLDTAPPGSICIAPCGCIGSQKWIQLGVFNKLRRVDPAKWKVCQTCRQPIQTDALVAQSNLQASLLGYVLDHLSVLRSFLVLLAAMAGYVLALPARFESFLVSRTLWQSVSVFSFGFLE